jgi:hypothetical protein
MRGWRRAVHDRRFADVELDVDPHRDFVDRFRFNRSARCARGGGTSMSTHRTRVRPGPGPSSTLLTPDRAGNVVGVDPHKRTLTATIVDPRGGIVASEHLSGVPTEGWEGVETMTRTQRDWAARRRGELAGDHGSRRVSSAMDAQRRLKARPARGTRTKADPVGPSDPRYAYLTRTYN